MPHELPNNLGSDITLLQETHSTKITEKQWQKEWVGISFWNAGHTNQGKIQNIKNDDLNRITSITFTLK